MDRTKLLQIHISPDLGYLSYHAPWHGIEGQRNTIINPLSLVECPHTGCLGDGICRFHSLPDANKIRPLIKQGVVFNFDNIKIEWMASTGVWHPTIDTFFFIRKLRENGYFSNKNIEWVWDLGCGTGIIGIYAALNAEYVQKVDFLDINESALLVAHNNCAQNNIVRPVEFRKSNGLPDNQNYCRHLLILSSPPYFPTPESYVEDIYHNKSVIGLELLKDLIFNAPKQAAEVVFICSDWDGNLISNLVEKPLSGWGGGTVKELGNMIVPLNIPNASAEYIHFLQKMGFVQAVSNSSFPYWHRIRIWSIKRNPKKDFSNKYFG